MISKRDVAKLLALAAAYDQRTVGAADIDAWHQVATAARWRPTDAARAVIEHYTTETDRVMPAHISRRIRERREQYAATYRHRPAPSGLHDVADEVAWEREQLRGHIDACMDRWAAGAEDGAA